MIISEFSEPTFEWGNYYRVIYSENFQQMTQLTECVNEKN